MPNSLLFMRRHWPFTLACIPLACSHPQPIGKRVYLAGGNISWVLPDSSLIRSRLILWPADFSRGEYGETGAFYHNRDSTVILLVYIKAFPDSLPGKAFWHSIANEQEQRRTVLAKNHDLAVIECYQADSTSQTITIDYHFAGRRAQGRLGRASYNKSLTIYGRYRKVECWFSGPDKPPIRQQFAAVQASIEVAPAYLQDTVAAYQPQALRD